MVSNQKLEEGAEANDVLSAYSFCLMRLCAQRTVFHLHLSV